MGSFAKKLRALREERGISAYALAQRTGLSKQALSTLEQGANGPNWETVQRLAKALGVDCTAFADEGMELPPEQPPGKPGRPPKQPPTAAAPPKGKRKGKGA